MANLDDRPHPECVVLVGPRLVRRCGREAPHHPLRVYWRGQGLGEYRLCGSHQKSIALNHPDVTLRDYVGRDVAAAIRDAEKAKAAA